MEATVQAHGGVITIRDAEAAGFTSAVRERAVRKGLLKRLRSGVFTSAKLWNEAGEVSRHRLKVLAQQRVVPGRIASGISAAVVLELPTPNGPPEGVQWTEARSAAVRGARGSRAGSSGRRSWLAESEISCLRSGIRVTSPVRTVLDCARELDLPWGLAVADAAIVRWKLDPAALVSAAEAIGPSVRGRKRALWVTQHARAGIESPLESLARGVILVAGFPEPTPQVWIKTGSGSYRVDLVDEVNRLIIEADGKIKYTEAGGPGQDKGTSGGRAEARPGNVLWQEKRREDALRDAEYEVIRFTMADYLNQPPWIAAYRRALARRTLHP